MAAVFISYRRDDTEGQAGRIFEELRRRLGEDRVFMDVTGIAPGVDFRKEIERAVSGCDVLLAVVGRSWLSAVDARGEKRLSDPKDFVRMETAAALRRDIPVIPVLVQGADMPSAEDLPEDLREFAFRNAVELRHKRWDDDIASLVEVLQQLASVPQRGTTNGNGPVSTATAPLAETRPAETAPAQKGAPASGGGRRFVFAAVAATIVAAGAVVALRQNDVEVPSVVGKSLTDARAAIVQARLKPGAEKAVPSAGKADQEVVGQSPTGSSKVKPDTVIDLEYALAAKPVPPTGPANTPVDATAKVAVPSVIGKPQADAIAMLRAAGLVTTVTKRTTDKERPGTVLAQEPAGNGEADKGTRVRLVVAVEPAPQVPDLAGMTRDQADAALRAAGLALGGADETISTSARAGAVIAQRPAAGESLGKGGRVDVTLAKAPPPVTVPDLTGRKYDEARELLSRMGLSSSLAASYVRADLAVALVAGQRPAAGTELAAGGTVLLALRPSATPPTPTAGTCIQGYVWREAFAGDRVCVLPQTRTKAQYDNSQAAAQREPNGGPYGPNTCRQGYVWREARSTDVVCVLPATRTEAASDNAQAASRVVR